MIGGLGAAPLEGGRAAFAVWAPRSRTVQVRLDERLVPLAPGPDGLHAGVVENVPSGALYRFRLDDGVDRPDPASRHQPLGVHGPSQIDDPRFPWTDAAWTGVDPAALVLYELHVGTFSREGTFDGVIPRLDGLRELGVTAIELMPVAQFPGSRNWGYDGVFPCAVQSTYGGPAGLRRLVDACHARGLGVLLDVVYNHLGPEGNVLPAYAPYLNESAATPWGLPFNVDGENSAGVRRYLVENAARWIRDFHLDGLRLDAVHAIRDASERHVLAEIAEAAHAEGARCGRAVQITAEAERTDPAYARMGIDAQWNDDFHHALHVLLTGERHGYYAGYGSLEQLASAYTQAGRFVVFSQNHDQVGNRRLGDRLDLDGQKLAAAAVLLSPAIPLLFMGEEHGETAPFQYFVSHGDPDLVEAVRRGRRAEFALDGGVPDPQDPATFERSRVDPSRGDPERRAWYRRLLELRRGLRLEAPQAEVEGRVLRIRYPEALLVLNFGTSEVAVPGSCRLDPAAAPGRLGPRRAGLYGRA